MLEIKLKISLKNLNKILKFEMTMDFIGLTQICSFLCKLYVTTEVGLKAQ